MTTPTPRPPAGEPSDRTHRIISISDFQSLLAKHGPRTPDTPPELTLTEGATPPPGPVAPQAIGSYKVTAVLGRGGMGVVYLAWDNKLHREVALKTLTGGAQADLGSLARFLQEADAIARLQHPGIVQVYEVGDHFGLPYIALEYLPGGSLADKLAREPQPARAAAEVVEYLARAMHYAHSRGVVHRDLKPGNILLADAGDGPAPGGYGWPKIGDFGLARFTEDDESRTVAGDVLGTPQYMSPEQAHGLTRLGPAVDVYALGAILYEMLTGQPPFDGPDPVQTVLQVRTEEPTAPEKLRPGLPRDLQVICLKCLEKEPDKRYGSAQALANDLRRWLDGQPILARPVRAPERAWKWARRHPALAALSAGLALTTVWAVAVLAWGLVTAVGARAEADRRAAVEHQAKEEIAAAQGQTQAALGLSESRLYFSRIARSHLSWRLGDWPESELALEQCLPADGAPDRRGWEWHYLRGRNNPQLAVLSDPAHETLPCQALAFAPDGRRLLIAVSYPLGLYNRDPGRDLGAAILWDLDRLRGRVFTVLRRADVAKLPPDRARGVHTGPVSGAAFAPDGKQFATCAADGSVTVRDAASLAVTFTDRAPHPAGAVAFSPDGRFFAYAVGDTVVLRDRPGYRELARWPARQDGYATLAFSPDGRTLAATGRGGSSATHVLTWELATLKPGREYRPPAGLTRAVAFPPHGDWLVTGDGGGEVVVWGRDEDRPRLRLTGHAGPVWAVAVSPDGRTIASASSDRTVHLWDAVSGRPAGILLGHADAIAALAFGPDGRTLATGGFQTPGVKLWDLTRQVESQPLALPCDRALEAVGFSADGRLLTLARNGQVRICDPRSGMELARQRTDQTGEWKSPAILAAFDAAGRVLAGASRDGRTAYLWDVAEGHYRHRLTGHTESIDAVALSADGSVMATAGGWWHLPTRVRVERGGLLACRAELRTWDAATGRPLWQETVPQALIAAVALSPDGRRLAVSGRLLAGTGDRLTKITPFLHLRDAASGTLLHDLSMPDMGPLVPALAFGPDGRRLAAAWSGRLQLWDTDTGAPAGGVTGPDAVYDLAFHPSGTRLAGASRDLTKIWDTATLQEVLTLPAPPRDGDPGLNPRVRFSADGNWLAVATLGNTVHLYDGRPRSDDAQISQLQAEARQATRDRAAAWHLSTALAAGRDRERLLFHLDQTRGLRLSPPELLARAGLNCWLERWDEVVSDTAAALTAGAEDYGDPTYQLLTARLLAGDLTGFRTTAAAGLDRAAAAGNREWLWILLHAAALGPTGSVPPDRLVKLLPSGITEDARFELARGLVFLRAGRLDEAGTQFRRVEQRWPNWPGRGEALAALALVEAQRGRPSEARRWLDQAEAWAAEVRRVQAANQSVAPAIPMPEWLGYLCLAREAARVVRPPQWTF